MIVTPFAAVVGVMAAALAGLFVGLALNAAAEPDTITAERRIAHPCELDGGALCKTVDDDWDSCLCVCGPCKNIIAWGHAAPQIASRLR